MFKYLTLLLESKTSKAFRAMDAQMELLHREAHGRSRTKAERMRDRKKVGAIVKSNISSALAQNKERDAELKYGVGKGVSPPSTTGSRIQNQRDLYNHYTSLIRLRRGKDKA